MKSGVEGLRGRHIHVCRARLTTHSAGLVITRHLSNEADCSPVNSGVIPPRSSAAFPLRRKGLIREPATPRPTLPRGGVPALVGGEFTQGRCGSENRAAACAPSSGLPTLQLFCDGRAHDCAPPRRLSYPHTISKAQGIPPVALPSLAQTQNSVHAGTL